MRCRGIADQLSCDYRFTCSSCRGSNQLNYPLLLFHHCENHLNITLLHLNIRLDLHLHDCPHIEHIYHAQRDSRRRRCRSVRQPDWRRLEGQSGWFRRRSGARRRGDDSGPGDLRGRIRLGFGSMQRCLRRAVLAKTSIRWRLPRGPAPLRVVVNWPSRKHQRLSSFQPLHPFQHLSYRSFLVPLT